MSTPKYQHCLSDLHRAQLAAHLAVVMSEDEVRYAIACIDYACCEAVCFLDPEFVAEYYDPARREEAVRLAAHADALSELLDKPRVRLAVETAADDETRNALTRIAHEARRFLTITRTRRRGRGRRPAEWRDILVRVIHDAYPQGLATKTRRDDDLGIEESHFESTVRMVLGFLSAPIDDVHGLVIKALKRQPDVPWRLELR